MCECVERIDNLLKERDDNTMLNVPLFVGDGPVRVFVETIKRSERKRGKPVKLFANFCPFCGEKYAEAAPLAERSSQQSPQASAEESK